MIELGIVVGIAVGVGACEVIGRHLGNYSIVGEVADWFKRLG